MELPSEEQVKVLHKLLGPMGIFMLRAALIIMLFGICVFFGNIIAKDAVQPILQYVTPAFRSVDTFTYYFLIIQYTATVVLIGLVALAYRLYKKRIESRSNDPIKRAQRLVIAGRKDEAKAMITLFIEQANLLRENMVEPRPTSTPKKEKPSKN